MTTQIRSNRYEEELRQTASNGSSVNHSEFLRREALITAALAEERRLAIDEISRLPHHTCDHGAYTHPAIALADIDAMRVP